MKNQKKSRAATVPTVAEGLHALAGEAMGRRDFDAAEEYLEQALDANPQDAAALSLTGEVLASRGEPRQALGYFVQAIRTDPANIIYKQNFLSLSGEIPFATYNRDIESTLLECFRTPELECANTQVLWYSILYTNPEFNASFRRVTRKGPAPDAPNPFEKFAIFAPLLRPYFLLGLKNVVVTGLRFEYFLTVLRRFLLEQLDAPKQRLTASEFTALGEALAHYCFNSEYIFDVTPAEQKAVDALQARLETGKKDALDPRRVAVFACYAPLYKLASAQKIAAAFADAPELRDLVRQQVSDYTDLRRAAEAVPALTKIDGGVSSKVREQYEEFPYPRWCSLPRGRLMLLKEDAAQLTRPGARALVAGCGTVQEAIHLAATAPQADILAVDLSRTSLAYAITRAGMYGIHNVTFRQADILKLGELGEKFDFITCSGVLHHMRDPMEGWKMLAGILKPGGLMRVALYSELARHSVVEAHKAITKGKYPSTKEGMRSFRRDSLKILSRETMDAFQNFRDYFYLSTYRDLLFHVQEHRFTIPQIGAAIKKLGLEFAGINTIKLTPAFLAEYARRFPNDPERMNLDNWHAMEQAHPDTFANMYLFWCRKPE